MTPDWSPLDHELKQWLLAGMTLPLWWRDDDAVTTGPALDRLAALAEAHEIAVHLAVVPKGATQELADFVGKKDHLIPVVHGWAHRNHASPGQRSSEFGDSRPLDVVQSEAAIALARLMDLFASRLCPMFVPPWNRIAPQVVSELNGLGYTFLSTFMPRATPFAAPGLMLVNTHLDPIAWRDGRRLLPVDGLIAQLTEQLSKRRHGRADNTEPYGILTHHLVHDDAIWSFTDALLTRLLAGPAKAWAAQDLT